MAGVPVDVVYLPKTDIEGTVGVVISSVRITTRLMFSDTLATFLRPTGECAAGRGNISWLSAGTTGARRTVIGGAVASASVGGSGDRDNSYHDHNRNRAHIGGTRPLEGFYWFIEAQHNIMIKTTKRKEIRKTIFTRKDVIKLFFG